MRRFYLNRLHDVSGVSGEGIVAEGVVLSNGQVVLRWLGKYSSIEIHRSIEIIAAIHGHDGKTVIEWDDAETEV